MDSFAHKFLNLRLSYRFANFVDGGIFCERVTLRVRYCVLVLNGGDVCHNERACLKMVVKPLTGEHDLAIRTRLHGLDRSLMLEETVVVI